MGHTNSTANLALPQFIGTDKPTWLGDINSAFSDIDAYAGTNDAAVAGAVADAAAAVSQASSAVSTATAANTTAGNANTTANNALGVANTANAIAGTVDAKVGLLADLNTTDRTSIVNAINEVFGLVGVNVTLVDTQASGATFAAQLAGTATAYAALSSDKKMTAFLKIGDNICKNTSMLGVFNELHTQGGTGAFIFNMYDLANTKHIHGADSGTGMALTDSSSNTNSNAIELYVIE